MPGGLLRALPAPQGHPRASPGLGSLGTLRSPRCHVAAGGLLGARGCAGPGGGDTWGSPGCDELGAGRFPWGEDPAPVTRDSFWGLCRHKLWVRWDQLTEEAVQERNGGKPERSHWQRDPRGAPWGHRKPQRDWGERGGAAEEVECERGRELGGCEEERSDGRGGRRERCCRAGGPRAGSSFLPASLVDQGWSRRGASSQERPQCGSVFKIPTRAARPQHGTEGRREAAGRARPRLWVPVRGRQRFPGARRCRGASSPHPESRAVCQATDTAPLPLPASLRALSESLSPPKRFGFRAPEPCGAALPLVCVPEPLPVP